MVAARVAAGRRDLPYGPATCTGCGLAFTRSRQHRRGSATCSTRCTEWIGRIGTTELVPWRSCVVCGSPFVNQRPALLCSSECRMAQARSEAARYYTPTPVRRYECIVCQETFERAGRHGKPQTCSAACQRRLPSAIEGKANRRARRRALKRTATVEIVYRRVVYDRDGWTCQLCTKPLRRDVRAPHPLSATLDHIVPLASGGDHSYRNIQAAHFICNSRKGIGAGQLRLIA